MAGTYNGSIHNGGPLTGDFFHNTEKLKRIGQQNAIRKAQATGRAVVSADGKRLLALAPRPDPRDYVVGPGVRQVVTGGRPAQTVTVGPGADYVAPKGAAGSGPGLGVVTVGGAFTSGPAAAGVVMAGSGEWFRGPELSVGLGKDQERVTAYKQFGIWMQPSPWFTDAQFFEDRAGDDGPGSWTNNTLTQLADWGNTAVLGIRYHVMGDPNEATKNLKPVPGGVWGGGASPYADAWPPRQ